MLAAVEKVRGANPMEGILELKVFVEAETPNVDAIIELGRFSIQSGQMDKAKERFVQAIDRRSSAQSSSSNSACSSWTVATQQRPSSISNGL